jgi:hypothetical protein
MEVALGERRIVTDGAVEDIMGTIYKSDIFFMLYSY